MSETSNSNQVTKIPKPKSFLNPNIETKHLKAIGKGIDRFGAKIVHNNIVGKFGGKFFSDYKQTIGTKEASEKTIENSQNRLSYLEAVKKNPSFDWKKMLKQFSAWSYLKYLLEQNELSHSQIIRLITKYLDYIGCEETKKTEIIHSLGDIKIAVETAQEEETITQTGKNIWRESNRDKRALWTGAAAVIGAFNPVFGAAMTAKTVVGVGFLQGIGTMNVARKIGQEAMEIRITEIMEKIDLNKLKQEIISNQIPSSTYDEIKLYLRKLVIYCVNSKQRSLIVQTLATIESRLDESIPEPEESAVDLNFYNNFKKSVEDLDNLVGKKETTEGKIHKGLSQTVATTRTIASGFVPLAKSIGNLCNRITREKFGKIKEQTEIEKKKRRLFQSVAIGWAARVGIITEIATRGNGEIKELWKNTIEKIIPDFESSKVVEKTTKAAENLSSDAPPPPGSVDSVTIPNNNPTTTVSPPPSPTFNTNSFTNSPAEQVTTPTINGKSGNWFKKLAENIVPQAPKLDITGSTLYQSLAQNKDSLKAIEDYMRVNQLNPNNIEMKQGIINILQQNGAIGIEEVNPEILKNPDGLKKAMVEIGIFAQNNGKTGLANGIDMFLRGEIPKAVPVQNIPQDLQTLTQVGQEIAKKNLERIGKVALMATSIVAGFWANNLIGAWTKQKDNKEIPISKRNYVGLVGSVATGGLIAGPVGAVAMGGIAVGSQVAGRIEKIIVEKTGKKIVEVTKNRKESQKQEAENQTLENNRLIRETEQVLANLGKGYLESVVNNGQIVNPDIFDQVFAKVIQSNLYNGTKEEIEESLKEDFRVLAEFETQKNNIPNRELHFYAKFATIIKKVSENPSTAVPQPPYSQNGLENDSAEQLEVDAEKMEILRLKSQIIDLLTPELQIKLNELKVDNGDNDLMKKLLEKLPDTTKETVSYFVNMATAKDFETKIYEKTALQDLATSLKSLTNIFQAIDAENVAQNSGGIGSNGGENNIDDEEPPEEELEIKPEEENIEKPLERTEIGAENAEQLALKNELLEFGKTEIKAGLIEMSYGSFLNSLSQNSLTPRLRQFGFTDQSVAEFKAQIITEIKKENNQDLNLNDLLRFIWISIGKNSLGNTFTNLLDLSENRSLEELKEQIKITKKAIGLIQKKVAELKEQQELQPDTSDVWEDNSEQVIKISANTNPLEQTEQQQNIEKRRKITELLQTKIGTQTLQQKLQETQKDTNKMEKLFEEFNKNREESKKAAKIYFDGIISFFVNLPEQANVTDFTDLYKQDLEFFLNFFQKEEIDKILQTQVEILGGEKIEFRQVLQEFVDGENANILQEMITYRDYKNKISFGSREFEINNVIRKIKRILINNVDSKNMETVMKYTKDFLLKEYNKVIAETNLTLENKAIDPNNIPLEVLENNIAQNTVEKSSNPYDSDVIFPLIP